MKQLDSLHFTEDQQQALAELRRRLFAEFDVEDLILYGSAARNEADEESDIDLLVLTPEPMARPARHGITDMVFDVNLSYGTNFSTLVIDRASWEAGAVSVLPFRNEIIEEGIPL